MVRYNQPRVEEALTQLKAGSAQTRAGGWGAEGLGALRMLRDSKGPGVVHQPQRSARGGSAWRAKVIDGGSKLPLPEVAPYDVLRDLAAIGGGARLPGFKA